MAGADSVADSQKLPMATSDKNCRNAKCPCNSGKKYKYYHGKP